MARKKCIERYCRSDAYGKLLRCCSCQNKRQRSKDPVKYAYQTIKDNAKRRGKRFVITLDEFREFCRETGYIELKGKDPDSASIDCIIDEIGYAKGNIECLSLRDNTLKRHKKVVYSIHDRQYYIVEQTVPDPGDDLPF